QNDPKRKEQWWLFGRSGAALRSALAGLSRYIATPETSKYRVFQFLPVAVMLDHSAYVIASDDAAILGVLSSRVQLAWASTSAGATLEDRPRWRNLKCFNPFPFPAFT